MRKSSITIGVFMGLAAVVAVVSMVAIYSRPAEAQTGRVYKFYYSDEVRSDTPDNPGYPLIEARITHRLQAGEGYSVIFHDATRGQFIMQICATPARHLVIEEDDEKLGSTVESTRWAVSTRARFAELRAAIQQEYMNRVTAGTMSAIEDPMNVIEQLHEC